MAIVIGEVVGNIVGDISRWTRDINDARRQGENFATNIGDTMSAAGRSITNLGSILTKSITLPLAGAGVAVFKLGKDFEAEMSHITGLVGVAKSQVDAWGGELLKLAPELGRAPKELAAGLYYVTSSGLSGAAAMDALVVSAKAASAGLGETEAIANLVTSAINAYGATNITAAQATDILVAAVREGKADAPEFAASLGQVLPIASTMGVKFAEVAGAAAVLTRNGLDAAESVTQIKAVLSGLIKPSVGAENALNEMGTSSEKLRKQIREEGLLATLQELNTLTKKYGDDALADVFPNIRAFSGALSLANLNSEENKRIVDECTNSTGMLNDAFKAASDTVDFKWNQSLAGAQATAIKLFDILKPRIIPVLEKITSVINKVGEKFASLSPKVQNIILVFAAMAAAIGPILLVVGGSIAALGAVISGLGTIFAVVAAIATAELLPLFVAIGAAVAVVAGVITALVGSFVFLWKTNDDFRAKVLAAWEEIKGNATIIFGEIKKTITWAITEITKFWNEHGETITKYLMGVWDRTLGIIKFSMETMKNYITGGLALIRGDWDTVWGAVKSQFGMVWDYVTDIVEKKLNEMKDVIKDKFIEIKDSIRDKLLDVNKTIIDWVTGLPGTVITGFNTLKDNIILKFNEIRTTISEKLIDWSTTILDWFKSIPTQLPILLDSWGSAITTWTKKQNEENIKQYGEWWKTIKKWFEEIPEKISKQLNDWWESMKKWFDDTKENITKKLNEWWESTKKWFEETPEKISKELINWWETMKKWFDDTKENIKKKLDEWWESIKQWFTDLGKKEEIKTTGKSMIDKLSEGTSDKKKDFIDKLGKIIVDVAKAAVVFAAVALFATGREIIKEVIKGVEDIDLKSSGKKIIQSLIDGLRSMISAVGKTASEIAQKIRDKFPFSPAKEGPLKDLDKVNFYSSIEKALQLAKNKVSLPSLQIGDEILKNIERTPNLNLNTGYNAVSSGINLYNPVFNGVTDMFNFMKEMKSTINRYTGRSL